MYYLIIYLIHIFISKWIIRIARDITITRNTRVSESHTGIEAASTFTTYQELSKLNPKWDFRDFPHLILANSPQLLKIYHDCYIPRPSNLRFIIISEFLIRQNISSLYN
jgi:hypothetical protein